MQALRSFFSLLFKSLKRVSVFCQQIIERCQQIWVRKAAVDCKKVDKVHVLCEGKKTEIKCKVDEVHAIYTKTALKCKTDTIHDICEKKKHDLEYCCDDLHTIICKTKKYTVIDKCCEVDVIVDCHKTDIKKKCKEIESIVDIKKIDIATKVCDLDDLLKCKITEIVTKSCELDTILEKKVTTIVIKLDALEHKLACKEFEMVDKCKQLDDFMDEKERDVGRKAEKIHILEALHSRRRNLKFWTKLALRNEINLELFGQQQ